MIRMLMLFLIVASSVSAAQQFSVLESDKVCFDGKKMVFADGVHLETEQGKISANRAEVFVAGALKFSEAILEGEVKIDGGERFTVTCDSAHFASEGVIVLKGDVTADFPDLGILTTDKELTAKLNPGKAAGLEYVKCIGETVLLREDEEKNLDRHARCNGEVFIDNQKQEIHFSSTEGQQLFFQENQANTYANKALLKYRVDDKGKITLTHITLDGDVRTTHREGALLQYVLADHVEIYPESQEMIFRAFEKKRVLFYDKVNNLQTSAPELRMKRDKVTRKDSFQGVGDVRFNFNEKEFEQLRKRFLPDEK